MKLKTFNLIICLILIVGCNKNSETKNSEKFSGFTAVGENKETAKFHIDTNTIKRDINGVVSFNMVRVLNDGYVIQNSQTDCKTNFNSVEAVKFSNDGTSQEKFLAETLVIPNQENQINTLVSVACSKAQDNRIITGAFDDAKALELLYGSYQSNTQTALWKNINPPSTLEDYERFLGKSGTVKIHDSKDFTQQEKTKHILLTSTSINDLEEVLLSAFVFIKIGDTWHIEKEYPYLKVAKEGKPNIFHWERIGKERYGIIEANSPILKNDHPKAYIAQYELNEQGLYNLFLYSMDNVLEYAKYTQNPTENVSIIFKESEKPYWDAALVVNNSTGQAQEIYQFKPIIELSLAENALKELFGTTNSSKKIKTAKDELTSIWFEQAFQDVNDNVRIVFTKTQFLDTEGNINACIGCGVDIGAVVYKKINGEFEWLMVFKQQNIGIVGQWGDAPEKQLEMLKFSSDKFLFLISNNAFGQGITDEQKVLLVFSKNNLINVGAITTGENNPVNCGEDTTIKKCFNYKGEISVIAGEKEYPDLLVTRTGTDWDFEKNKIIPARNDIYVFNGKEYQLKDELKEKQDIKQSEQNSSTLQTNQQQTQSDNKKWTRDFGNGIISTIVSEPCQIPEFTNQGYTYSISSSIPIARLKQKNDAWQISGNTATTVLGCWFKSNELIHAKFIRKKDGKTWEQDFKLDDGSWALIQETDNDSNNVNKLITSEFQSNSNPSFKSDEGLDNMMKIYNNPESAPTVVKCQKNTKCNAFVALSKQWQSIPKSYRYHGFDIKDMAKNGDGYGLNKGFYFITERTNELKDAGEEVYYAGGKMGKKDEYVFARGLAILLYIEDKNGWAKN